MVKNLKWAAVFGFLAIGLATAASADAVDDAFAKHLGAGNYVQGAAELSQVTDAKASAAAGTLQFAAAIEHLGQSLYRYGLTAPEGRRAMVLPVLRMPVPVNPNPEKLNYKKFRGVLEALVADLDAADANLSKLGDAEAKLLVDFSQVRFDFDGNGTPSLEESLPGILSSLMGESATPPTSFTVGFDTADVYWLRGYGRFVSGFAQFMLAHDFENTFNKTFHVFFPRAALPTGELLATNSTLQPYAESEIGDLIAMFHLINWPTVDAARLADSRLRFVAMAELSPKSWAAARKETDNDREWLPAAKQTQAITGSSNDDDVIDGWLAVMGEFKAVLEGQKLMGHWRFDKGMNVKRFFNESKSFDLVLWFTGTDAVHYLEDGEVSNSTTWNRLMGTFRGNFLGYALWFN